MRKKQRLPAEPTTTEIEKFSHDGRGIARIDGKTTFIQNALPGETVSFQYLRQKRDFDEGRVVSVIKSSPHRAEPRCPHYLLCGGCSLQHLDESTQIHEKQALLLDLLERIGRTQPETILAPLTSELWHYRNKARLSVRYVEKKQSALVGFREKNNPRYITEIEQCPVLNARVDAQIVNLRGMLDSFEAPHSIAQIEVAAGDDDIALIFRNLSPLSQHDEEKLKEFSDAANFRIFLQPAGPDSVFLFYPKNTSDFLTYQLPDEAISFKFHPTDFTQVNAGLNRLMVQQALSLLALESQDVVLDLFCGLGNFSLPMAKHCAKVVGVEGSEAMVLRAGMNARDNGLENTEFLCANLEDESSLLSLKQHNFSKVLLDPPRTGAMEIVKQIDKLYIDRLVYVSCNPATLARDTDILVNQQGFRLVAAGVMDMFPHTAHVESIALFEK
jgi:23S rRNA (uracil1939-C5)-methyltransferase